MMGSIEKLRESSHLDDCKWTLETGEVVNVFGYEPDDPNAVNWGEQWRKIADEIEAEVAERYVKRPLDADGAPVFVGDVLTRPIKDSRTTYTVEELKYDGRSWWYACDGNYYACEGASHVKPDPLRLKELLNDYLQEREKIVRKLESNMVTLGEAENEEDACDETFAGRIRELMEVD